MTAPHLFLWAEDSEAELQSELSGLASGVAPEPSAAGLLQVPSHLLRPPPAALLVFSRQWLPFAEPLHAESIREWINCVAEKVISRVPDEAPWMLHVEPHYWVREVHRIGARAWHSDGLRSRPALRPPTGEGRGSGTVDAGRHRCQLIRAGIVELLKRRRKQLLRNLAEEPRRFGSADSLIQVLLTAPNAGFCSVARAPLPFEQPYLISVYPKGELPIASDRNAPSRAFSKLVEAQQRLGRQIRPGEECVDLGASPGSWTYVAVAQGAHVVAVDRAPLREDLMRHSRVTFHKGDAFQFSPPRPVDWLLCDVIAEPSRSAELLLTWLRNRWCRRFVVTIKLRDATSAETVRLLKRELPALSHEGFLTRLCANKKEICAFGSV